MNALSIALVAASALAGAGLAFLLFCRHSDFNTLERFGLGLITGGTVMTIGPAIAEGSPFDIWAGILLRTGIILFVVGWGKRRRATL